jgi:hypothetical protein
VLERVFTFAAAYQALIILFLAHSVLGAPAVPDCVPASVCDPWGRIFKDPGKVVGTLGGEPPGETSQRGSLELSSNALVVLVGGAGS